MRGHSFQRMRRPAPLRRRADWITTRLRLQSAPEGVPVYSTAVQSDRKKIQSRLPQGSRRDGSAGHDQPSFRSVVLPNLDAAYNLARWLTGDRASAEDVVHDA